MEMVFMDEIEAIIEKLEYGSFESFAYKDNLFHIIDKEEQLDFQIKLGKNNYYFKDNINKSVYMFVKKYLDERTTLQKIFFDNGQEQFYYSYLEKDGFIKMARMIRKNNDEHIICDNTQLMGKSEDELIKYAYENWVTDEDLNVDSNEKTDKSMQDVDIFDGKYAKDSSEEGEFKYINETDEEELNGNNLYEESSYYDEYLDEDDMYEDETYGGYPDDEGIYEESDEDGMQEDYSEDEIVENFEEITIPEFVDLVYEQAENYMLNDYERKEDDMRIVSKLYEPFVVVINGEEQYEINKILMAQECELIVESKFLSSIILSDVANEFKMVLDAINKNMDKGKQNDIGKKHRHEENWEPEK